MQINETIDHKLRVQFRGTHEEDVYMSWEIATWRSYKRTRSGVG
jgi:hypothetical protein